MCQRKVWTAEEDQLLTKIMEEEGNNTGRKKLKWNEIANRINQLGCKTLRKGKQCRERWFNQLHPKINRDQNWLPQEEQTLFNLQSQFGNHWSKIAKKLPGRSDNHIKNYFYSSLRKALRKVNNYIYNNKHIASYKNIKPFQKNTLSKVLIVAEKKSEHKIQIAKEQATELAQTLKNLLIRIQITNDEEEGNGYSDAMPIIVSKIQEFNRICKRKKSKKKGTKKAEYLNQESQSEQSIGENKEGHEGQDQGISCQNESVLSEDNYVELDAIEVKQEDPFKRQHLKQSRLKVNHKYSDTRSTETNRKVKTNVIIPLCHSNCQSKLKIQHSESLKTVASRYQTAPDLPSLERPEEVPQRSFMPYLPVFQFSYYPRPTIVASVEQSTQRSSFLQPTLSNPFAYANPFMPVPKEFAFQRVNSSIGGSLPNNDYHGNGSQN